MCRVKAFHNVASILVEDFFMGSTCSLSFLNCYGPYLNRELFWEAVIVLGSSNGWGHF